MQWSFCLGLSMRLDSTKDDLQYFVLEHSKAYQKVQFEFLDAVETLHPENIIVSGIPAVLCFYLISALIKLLKTCLPCDSVQYDLIIHIFYVSSSLFSMRLSRIHYRSLCLSTTWLLLFYIAINISYEIEITLLRRCKILFYICKWWQVSCF